MARRDHIPPYEIMRSRGERGVPGDVSGDHDAGGGQDSAAAPSSGKAPWWVGSAAPLVLRVPRGLAVAGIAGLLLLVILAYWVGKSRGRSLEQQAQAQVEGPQTGVGSQRPGSVYESRTQRPGPEAATTDDPPEIRTHQAEKREQGLNYFRLATIDPEEGRQIAEFMAAAGIDIQLNIDENRGRCVVYAVERGFRANELDSDERRALQSDLMRLGRLWKQQRSGNTDFNSMQPERYNGD